MRAIFCERLGGPEHLVLREVPSPSPGPGEVRVALRARGVSFVDVLVIAGEYQTKREVPFIPGGEAAGVVVEVGSGVQNVVPGDRVLAPGGYADEAVVPAARVIPLPDTVSFETAAAFRSSYATAYYGLQRGRLAAGEILLVHGAAGGVGLAAVDVGKLLGATVIATASSAEKLAVCKQMGADHVIDYTKGFRDQVRALTADRGADVIYDPVGGDVTDESMRCIAPFGRLLIIGFTSGRPAELKTNHLLIKDAEAIGFTIGALSRLDPARERKNLSVLMTWLGAGRITPHVSHRLPLEKAAEALTLVRERKVIGKAVLV
ncbi:MAG TPA: NADPH:quinone oxidoreductase family protein [Candidatus Acidoferrum sp.]|nr:NADPH:quinone oxidoreductase family protein [Candidatus Acidoferrum sp.]